MKQLIVYYSLDGNSDYIARSLAKETGADLLRLTPVHSVPKTGAMKYIRGGMSALSGWHPKLQPYEFDPEEYDCIILGCPVWAGRIAAPMTSFLKKEQLQGKRIKLFICHADENDLKPLERFKKMVEGNTLIKEMAFVEPFNRKEELSKKSMKEFMQAE